jgi:hypothetical protein
LGADFGGDNDNMPPANQQQTDFDPSGLVTPPGTGGDQFRQSRGEMLEHWLSLADEQMRERMAAEKNRGRR